MDSTQEQAYAQADGPNRAMPAKLGSKEGTNRDATRGASQDVAGDGGAVKDNPAGYKFFGAADGSNNDTFHAPDVKEPSKPTLGDY